MRDTEQSPYLWILLVSRKDMHDSECVRMRFVLQSATLSDNFQPVRHRAPCLFGYLQPIAGFEHLFCVLNQPTAMHIVAF